MSQLLKNRGGREVGAPGVPTKKRLLLSPVEKRNLIAPLIEFAAGHRVRIADGRRARSLWEVAEWVAGQYGTTGRHALRLFRAYEKGGEAALKRKPYANHGLSKLFGRGPQTIPDDRERLWDTCTKAGEYIAELHLLKNYSPAGCHEALAERAAELGCLVKLTLPDGTVKLQPPSEKAVAKFLNSIPVMVRNFVRLTAQQWNDRHRPSVRRDYYTAKVMGWWNMDHAQDDFFTYNDYIPELECFTFPDFDPNKSLRIWFTGVQDVRSRYLVGYAFSAIPNGESVASAIRVAVLRTGSIALNVLTDRGLDFLSELKDGDAIRGRILGPVKRLGEAFHGENFNALAAIGRNPQSKPIESWFRFKRERFDSRELSRCGNAPHRRPDSTQQLLDKHEAWVKTGAEGVSPALPRASAICFKTRQWVEQEYHGKHEHTGHAMNLRTPEQVFREGWSLEQQEAAQARLDPRLLEEFLWRRELRKVRKGCMVRLYGADYAPADKDSWAALRAWDGDERMVEVGSDPYQRDYAVAYHPETGERLGALVSTRRFAWGEPQENIKAHLRSRGDNRRAVVAMIGQLGGAETPSLLATGTENANALPLVASSPRVLRARAEREASKQLASPFISDSVKQIAADFWNEGEE